MKKWLVGLLAAGLCAASAWATTDTLTAADFTATSTTYAEFSGVSGDSGAVYAGKTSKSSDGAIQMRSNGSDCGIVTTGSGGTATKVTIVWNAGTTNDTRSVDIYGSNSAYSAASDLFSKDAQGEKLGSLNKGNGDTELVIEGEYAFIGLRSNSGALMLDSVSIEWSGEAPPVEFSIALDPAEDFEVVQGKSATITATVKGAQGDVAYSWSVGGTPIDLAGNVYTVDSSAVGGPFEVVCEASDGVSDPVSASVKYTVVEAPVITGDQLTRETTGVEGSQYKDWTVTGDSGTVYAGNSAGGNDSIQLRTTSPAGIVITKSAGSDVASVTVEWNDNTTSNRSIQVYGSTSAYTGPADLYGDDKGDLLGTIARTETSLEIPAGYPYVGILAKSGALYLDSVTIGFGGAAGPSVSLDPSAEEVGIGEPVTITATANNFSGDVEWSWTGTGTADGATFTVDTSVAGEYEITATATAGEETASKSVTIKVIAKYAVNVALDIQNGTVATDVSEAAEGDTVTVTATPADGYRLAEIIVNNGEVAVSGNTFVMPAQDVLVTATFEEFAPPAVYITFEEGTYPTSYAATEAEVENHGTLAETVPTVKFAVAQTYRGSDANDKKVGDVSLRLRAATSGDVATNGVFGNAEAFEEAISSLSFQYARYGTDAAPTALKVLVSADGETWDELADLASTATAEMQTYSCDEIPAGSVFFKIEMANSAKSFKRVNIDEIALEFGAPKPSIGCEGETSVEIPGSFSIQFTLKNYDGGYAWAVESGEGGTIDESGLYTWTPSAGGEFTIKVKAVDGDTEIASKEVVLTVTAPEPPASYISCNVGTAVEATVGVPVAFEFTANGVDSVDDWYAEWKDGDEIALAYSGDNMSASFDWTPSEAGSFTIAVSALVQPDSQLLDLSVVVTVSEAGPGGDLAITGFSSSKAGLSFDAPADGVAVEEATSLTDQDWTPINIAPVDGKIVIPLNGEGKFYRFAK